MSLPAVDKEGFLRNLADWSPEVATRLAQAESIELTDAHWQVINLARQFYDDYHISPAARVLVKLVREHLGAETGDSIYLMQLFGGRPARVVSKVSGLPKPTNCD